MPEPTPPLDLAAIAARHQAYPSPVGQLCDDDEQEWPCDAAALVARVRALEAEVARLQPRPTRGQACYICGRCPVVACDAETVWFCAQHAGSDCTPL
jgi:hypothetical protein